MIMGPGYGHKDRAREFVSGWVTRPDITLAPYQSQRESEQARENQREPVCWA